MKYIPLVLLALLQVLLSATLSYKKKSRVSRLFMLFAGILFIWTLANIILDYTLNNFSSQPGSSLLLLNWANQIGFFSGTITLVCLYRLVLVFPLEQKESRASSIITLWGVITGFLALLPAVSGSYALQSSGKPPQYQYSNLTLLILIYFIVISILSIRIQISSLRRASDPIVKMQARTVLSGLFATTALAILIIMVLPPLVHNDSFIFLGYFTPYIFTGSLFYSIFRQRFLNFQAIVARSVGYILSLSTLILFFSVVAFGLIRGIAGSQIDTGQALIFVAVSSLAAITFKPVKDVFDKVSNRVFYRDAYDAKEVIDDLNKVLVANIDIDEIMKKSATSVANHLKLTSCTFVTKPTRSVPRHVAGNTQKKLLDEDSDYLMTTSSQLRRKTIITDELDDNHQKLKTLLNEYEIAALSRMLFQDNNIGFLAVGSKKSGNPISIADCQILEIISNEVSIAIQNALRFEEISHFNITLQQKVEEATKELQVANERLKALDAAKDEFISMASHQLRTPLTAVKGYLSMVLEGDAGDINKNQKDLIKRSFNGTQRMVYLIADLLNVSRLQTGKFVIENKLTNLPEVVSTEVNQLKDTAEARHLTLTYKKPTNFPRLMLDETKVRQVIMNFLDNAIYYTPVGGKIVTSLEATDKDITYTVTDTGIGVPKEDQHRLFAKFYRTDNARKTRPDGTGLGLFMAKKVITAQGGDIIFRSTEGQGSTFGFTFPRDKVEAKK
jgi:signal transduction histidine kinase